MKKVVKYLSPILFFIVILSVNFEGIAENRAPEEGCKWKQLDCDGWLNGTYEACLENGDGNSCDCGSVTRNCEGDDAS